MAPVVALSVAQLGKPVADQFVAGRLALSVSAGVAENADPTLPLKVCPAAMMGAEYRSPIVTLIDPVLTPPGPVAVSSKLKAPMAEGVPVICPVVALIVAQLGKAVPAQLVTGRSMASVMAGVALNADPTLPVKVCPAVIIGAEYGASMMNETVVPPVPPSPVAVREAVLLSRLSGVPEMAPVSGFRIRPAGRGEVAAHRYAGR